MRYHRVRSPALFRALARTALLFWCVLTLTFALLRLAPGDPATFLLPPAATAADAARLRAELGLDRPIAVQYARWVARTLRGDLGTSFVDRRPVTAVLARRAAGLARARRAVAAALVRRSASRSAWCRRRGADARSTTRSPAIVRRARRVAGYWLGLGAIACFTYLASSLEPAAVDATARVRHDDAGRRAAAASRISPTSPATRSFR